MIQCKRIYHDGDVAWNIAEAIASRKSEKIFVRSRDENDFVSKYELSQRDKEAIADCVPLDSARDDSWRKRCSCLTRSKLAKSPNIK